MAAWTLPSFFAGPSIVLALAGSALAEEDYAKYRVLNAKVIENMWAGPAQSAALLSPDGSRLLHLGHRNPDMCLFAPAQIGSWGQIACADYTADNRPGEAEDMFWSPGGNELLMPSSHDAFVRFRDTDVRVFDAATFTVRNLTDDGFDGGLTDGEGPAQLDVLARWGDANTIFFVRYSIPAGGFKDGVSTSLMRIAADGAEPQEVLDITSGSRMPVLNFAVSADGRLLAFSQEDREDAENAGIYLLAVDGTEPIRVARMADLGGIRLAGLAFSADRKFLLLVGRTEHGNTDARVLDLATGDIAPVDATQNVTGVAWSPTGSALAYLTYDRAKPDMPGGLFLAPAPGRPARLLIGGGFYPPVCCGDQPFIWATDDTIVLSQVGDQAGTVLYIQLGKGS